MCEFFFFFFFFFNMGLSLNLERSHVTAFMHLLVIVCPDLYMHCMLYGNDLHFACLLFIFETTSDLLPWQQSHSRPDVLGKPSPPPPPSQNTKPGCKYMNFHIY